MKIIIIGSFSEIFEVLEEDLYDIVGYINFEENYKESGYKWLGTDNDVKYIKNKYPLTEIIISPDCPNIRKKLNAFYKKNGFAAHTFISSKACVSKSAVFKQGVFVQKIAHISSNCIIGKMVKINVAANIMHDCLIGDYTTVAPNAVILGNVSIGNNCYIGANATILPNIKIGNDVIVGAGAVVTKDIKNNLRVAGIPAKAI
jgi:sugar O-acyltransferase (sialic acid O-acetyltransferase NeuD family)